jgi:hypothetical protein
MVVTVASLPDVIGLLYRADWTRLSLSADMRFESDRDLAQRRRRTARPPEFPDRPAGRFRADPDGGPPTWDKRPEEERDGYHRRRATLLMAPGGRYRQEFGDDPPGRVQGSDGERSWIWYRPDLAPGPGFSVYGGNEPATHDANGHSPASDDLLYRLYRSGENPVFRGTLHQWRDLAAMAACIPERIRAAGHGGAGYFLDMATREKTVVHTVARLCVSGRDKYRIDYLSHRGRQDPTTIACDGQHRWRAYPAAVMVGPAAPLPWHIADLADSSWLLECRLSGGTEISYRGRRAHQLHVTRDDDHFPRGPLAFFPADVIVDSELGCLLRLISYADDQPASWWELRDISTQPGEPGEFRLHVPPGVPTVEETGNPLADAAAVMPGTAGYAVRTAATLARQAAAAVSATRSFLDDLRSGGRGQA